MASSTGEPTETDYSAVGCAITTISSNLTEMSKGVKMLAALMDNDVGSGHKLMGAARMLAGAVSDLLRSVEPAAAEVSTAGSAFLSTLGLIGFFFFNQKPFLGKLYLYLFIDTHLSAGGGCNKYVVDIFAQPRQTVLTAAGSIGQASGDLLRHMGEGEIDEKFQV